MRLIQFLPVLIVLMASCQGDVNHDDTKSKVATQADKTVQSVNGSNWSFIPSVSEPAAQISEYIRRVFQDSKGNLWFGTNGDGVCRYDGKTLTYFGTNEGFCGSAVRGIVEDKNATLWFGTDQGVCQFDGKSFTNFTEMDGLPSNQVWSILIDRNEIIWIGTELGAVRYDPSGKSSFLLTMDQTLTKASKTFTAFPLPEQNGERNPDAYPAPKMVSSLYEDKAGNIWLGTNGDGAFCWDGKTLKNLSEKDGLCNNYLQCILEDHSGNMWFGSRFGGLSRYNRMPANGTNANRFTNFTEQNGLCHTFVWTMMEDSQNNLWIGTAGGGSCRYEGQTFTSYSASDGLPNRHVQSIFEDQNHRLWFGCSGGLFRMDGNRFVNVTKAGPW
jgi:ligand-binding sensor domain-containing protein